MNAIGAISILAAQASQPFTSAAAVATSPVDPSPDDPSSGDLGAAISGQFSAEYAMKLLSVITHASADQALTLIQMVDKSSPTR